jgi:hypothetical protein
MKMSPLNLLVAVSSFIQVRAFLCPSPLPNLSLSRRFQSSRGQYMQVDVLSWITSVDRDAKVGVRLSGGKCVAAAAVKKGESLVNIPQALTLVPHLYI